MARSNGVIRVASVGDVDWENATGALFVLLLIPLLVLLLRDNDGTANNESDNGKRIAADPEVSGAGFAGAVQLDVGIPATSSHFSDIGDNGETTVSYKFDGALGNVIILAIELILTLLSRGIASHCIVACWAVSVFSIPVSSVDTITVETEVTI